MEGSHVGVRTMRLPLWRRLTRNVYRKVMVFLVLLLIIWCATLANITLIFSVKPPKESEVLKNEIIRLSEEYVKALSRENGDMVDGPYAGRFTAYDLKKTMAVLLESMLERLQRLESAVNLVINTTLVNDTINATLKLEEKHKSGISARDLINGRSINCKLTDEDKAQFPHCEGKMMWMSKMWKSDPCYATYGVDGSDCSYVMYLSEVEGWCPKKAWGGSMKLKLKEAAPLYANITSNLEDLMVLLRDPNERQGYAWIRMRITRMWDKWSSAIHRLAAKQNLVHRKKKKILVHLGLLSKQSGWKFAEMQFKGGPLGELVQWSDLITTLFLLGHDLTITSEVEQLVGILSRLPAAKSPCQSRKELPVNIIYTDIMGLIQFKKRVKGGYGKFSCLFRIVDSFGTEPAYNHRSFAKQNKILTSWGGQDLQPRQFFTMFPHSPDNSFMGFVVEQHLNDSHVQHLERQNKAVVYGKKEYMWEKKDSYLNVIKDFLEIHGTVYYDEKQAKLPDYVVNHGLLNGADLHKLLRESKVFIGMGFPYEGPAPLEAIANGAVFLNARFDPPHGNKNDPVFKGKPTQRELTSQHPYAEMFIGKPHVYTINIKDTNEVTKALQEILHNNTFEPYLPYEYSEEGMLQRMNAYIEHQDFCKFQKQIAQWPPSDAVRLLLGSPGKSCKDACWEQNLICEPSHFMELNSLEEIEKLYVQCSSKHSSANIYYPAFNVNTKECTLQGEELLFSCVGGRHDLRRLCPCRNYIRGQTALCVGCQS
ncbi:alpha-1,6-mannosylglycoprotein 6-beta-N-acetylglucosaminyltransferase A-like isoform X1 [Haliotis rubra]|uniref:alpha-1,6-mannosylglycoprotein 6-beta-N-acetylglucosaminyltransferase A-like isoform X1 n=2 Tax=Haliotis rubra TaxID=36100 RepID=UPI001EE58931|nr:alpha-1,6-mannosylglycoprotein 6-beta-N-acetylglucosaminyltransferase A-like isoform X1 [Haliotis rubra]